jgi:hypothetical protein
MCSPFLQTHAFTSLLLSQLSGKSRPNRHKGMAQIEICCLPVDSIADFVNRCTTFKQFCCRPISPETKLAEAAVKKLLRKSTHAKHPSIPRQVEKVPTHGAILGIKIFINSSRKAVCWKLQSKSASFSCVHVYAHYNDHYAGE